jgi:hypothetical protein
MNKISRMVHAGGFCFKAFGITFGVRTNQPTELERIEHLLPPGSTLTTKGIVDRLYSFVIQKRESRPGVHHFHLLFGNSQMLARTESLADLMDIFESDVNFHIATTTSRRFFVHAGVVAWKGKAIVIPGRSHTGKTTLVKEFLRQGASYYSDEFAVFDSRGHVQPFAKALSIRDDRTQQQTRISAEQFGCPVGIKPLRIEFVLLTQYQKTARWRPRNTSRGQAVLHLLQNSFSIRKKPEAALAFAEAAVRNATILTGVRGEAEEVVRSVLSGTSSQLNRDGTNQIIQPQGESHGPQREHQAEAVGNAFAGSTR